MQSPSYYPSGMAHDANGCGLGIVQQNDVGIRRIHFVINLFCNLMVNILPQRTN